MSAEQKVIDRDDHFVKYENEVVNDSKTGLEWFAGPDEDMDWEAAVGWAESLQVDAGGWRIPTREELQTLYQEGKGQHNVTPLLNVTGWWIWVLEKEDPPSGLVFDFSHGKRDWYARTPRAVAVRSRSGP